MVAQRGFALVTVLLLASLLLVMLVGLLSMSSEEGQRAEYYVEGEQSRGYVGLALAEVKAKLMDGGEIPYKGGVARASMAASPGLLEVRRYDVLPNRGYQVGREAFMDPNSYFRKPFAREYERGGQGDWQPANPRWIALYSQKWYAPLCKYMSVQGDEVRDVNVDYNPERVFDLNREDNPFRPGRLYFGGVGGQSVGVKNVALGGEYAVRGREGAYRYREGESSVERPVYVQWIPVYQDSRYGAVKPDGQNNPIVGRYAYWVDVENTKININQIKREWEKTALGELTGLSDAERSRGSYYRQRGEGRGDTERYRAERYLPRAYKLFGDEVDGGYGVELSYRVNYGRVRGEDRSGEFYRERVLGWEDRRVPPAIADTSVIDSRAFIGMKPYRGDGFREYGVESVGGGLWGGGVNVKGEEYSELDPAVERREMRRGKMSLQGMEKMYGQVYTVYGWEEERDPLGRAKLDINEILREGDALFDRGFGLPEGDHRGSELEQLIARTEDGRYYGAYYPGGYGSGGEGKSLVDSLSVFAGRGVDAGRYGRAMRDQMLVNVIEYGRAHEDSPFIDRERGVVGAKSMPYVGEVAIRVRNGIWGAWEDFDEREELEEMAPPDRNEPGPFKGLFPGIGDFDEWGEDEWQRFAQKIYDSLFKNMIETDPNVIDNPNIPPVRHTEWSEIDGKNLGGMLASVLTDGALALVNPDPLNKTKGKDWEIEFNYSWYDASSIWLSQFDNSGTGFWDSVFKDSGSEFYEADGSQRRIIRKTVREGHYQPSLLPGTNAQVDHRGYFFPEEGNSSQHHLIYFRPGIGYLPGEGIFDNKTITIFGGGSAIAINSYQIPRIFQPFRLWGWRIYRRERGQRQGLFHEVPMRHPGQKSVPRLWWQMSVGDANAGVVGSRIGSRHYADLHSLAHFQQSKALVNGVGREQLGVPFGLGLSAGALVRSQEMELEKRKDVATSWFSSLTMAEFRQQCESLLKQMPKRLEIRVELPEMSDFAEHGTETVRRIAEQSYGGSLELSLSDKGFYHIHEEPVRDLIGLEGYLYFSFGALEVLRGKIDAWRKRDYEIRRARERITSVSNHESISDLMEPMRKALSDLIYFIMLQLSVRDEGMHEGGRERSQEFTGRSGEDGFKEGVAMVERVVCIDPVLGHRTGNPDLRINREGQEYRGHFYGMNGHGWRRHHYYFYHYDERVMEEQLGLRRAEPDRSLSYHFRDPRRCDGSIEYEPEDHRGGEGYSEYRREKLPLVGVTGSVLMDAVLTKSGDEEPYLGGELGWSRVSEVEGDGVRVWPYMRGMDISYGYGDRDGGIGSRRERLAYRKGSYLTHSVGGRPMVSIGELGMCHSGFLQRVIDLGRPPMASAPGVKRLGSVEHGPPLSMLLDLVVSSNFRDEEGNYLSREQWERGEYRKHSPENPRVGRWSVNCQWAHDNYVGVREGAHGELSDGEEVYYTEEMRGEWVHPVLVPNGVWGGWSRGEQRRSRVQGVVGDGVLDPYLRPGISVRRGWEQWMGMVVGDYSPNRNLGRGVWEKAREGLGEAYDIAQGTLNCVPLLGERGLLHFGGRAGYRGESRLLVLGREVRGRGIERNEGRGGIGGHVSADGPAVGSVGAYELVGRGVGVSLYDVTRYGLYPLCHHISEVGYSGLGRVHTALNPKSATTESQGGYWGEKKLVEEGVGGDGMLGAMSQAGFARNSAWVLSGNQMSTSANVFTVHIVVQSLRDGGGRRSKEQEARRKKSLIPDSQSPLTGHGYMDEWDEVLGEQWAQVVVARVPRRGKGGKIIQDKHGAPQYAYRILSQEVLQNPR